MRLGEALSLRALQTQKLSELRSRISANAVTQEGTEPQADSMRLLEEYEELSRQHGALVLQINRSNVGSALDEMLQRREHLRRCRNNLVTLARTAETSQAGSRFMRSELRTVSHVNSTDLHARIDALTEELRMLDAAIQQRNWETDVDVP